MRLMRSIHHFACTGGTLISRCVGADPAVQLLSEVDPLSDMGTKLRFAPTDVVKLAQYSSHPPDRDTILDVFFAGLDTLQHRADQTGAQVVIRAHDHSKYCNGPAVADRPSVRDILARHYALKSLVTVRHPIDSYLSLQKNGWLHFEPTSFEEYCRRYLQFLQDHDDLIIIRYEDFIRDPDQCMQQICAELDLPFNPGYRDGMKAITLSGDSGRKGDTIAPRDRLWVPKLLQREFDQSLSLQQICLKLKY